MVQVGGKISVSLDGNLLSAKGEFEINPGFDKNDMVLGHDKVHGHKTLPQVPMIKGEVTVTPDLDLTELMTTTNGVVTVEGGGKTYTLQGAVQTAEGLIRTEEGNLELEFQGLTMTVDP